ncbi:MAG: hypothetical protein AB7K86_24100 [Rhodospirillales bacterium]
MAEAEHRDNFDPSHEVEGDRVGTPGAAGREEKIRGSVSERVRHVAEAARSAQSALQGEERWLAQALSGLGGQLEDLSDAVATRGIASLRSAAERIAKDRPALFLGAAVAVGFGIGRVLRASPAHGDGLRADPARAHAPANADDDRFGRTDPRAARTANPEG